MFNSIAKRFLGGDPGYQNGAGFYEAGSLLPQSERGDSDRGKLPYWSVNHG